MQVIKRGGKVYQEFDKTRIETAIISAFESCNIELSPEKLELIMSNILMEIEKFKEEKVYVNFYRFRSCNRYTI